MKILPGLFIALALVGCSSPSTPPLPVETIVQRTVPTAPKLFLLSAFPRTVTYACEWSLTPPIYYRVTGLEEAPEVTGPWRVVTNIPVPFVDGIATDFIMVTNSEYPNGYLLATNHAVTQQFSATWVSTNVDRVFTRTFAHP